MPEVRRAKSALAPGDEAPWQDLPPELLPRILARLPTNEVPCTARLVCKAAAAALSSPAHTTVRLSQPSPHGEFARRWGAPGAMRPLTLDRRRRLLALTAASGCLHNLAWLVEHAGCSLDNSVLEAAAAAGRLEACRWLLQQQGGEGTLARALEDALWAAAGAGQRSALEALLAHPGAQDPPSPAFCASLAINAARGGHVGLMDWLLERCELTLGELDDLLSAAAAGCDLPTLERLFLAHQPLVPQLEQESLDDLLGCAASSLTPDWRAKVEWVEACLRAPLDTNACAAAAACPDALERLAWLRARGCMWDSRAVASAAGAGNVEALIYLLAEGCEVHYPALRAAGEGGHLAVLEFLHSHGIAAFDLDDWACAATGAACEGQLPVVRWMLERQLIDLKQQDTGREHTNVLTCAAQSGSIELMALLRACGCGWIEDDLYAAAEGGSEEALEWAVAQGCLLEESNDEEDDPYLIAAKEGDWSTLACLGRLAVPWRSLNRRGGTFTNAVEQRCSVPILRRLLELGCPVDWPQAAEVAESRGDNVRAWLKEEEERRSEVEGAPQQQ